jgi:predicted lactoylglutathione lyase
MSPEVPAHRGRKLFLNLPVAALDRAVAFFTALGFTFNPMFTDETATCMLVGDDAFVMLLVQPRFDGFSARPRPDGHATTGHIIAFSVANREEVDRVADAALALGGQEAVPATDHGFMYTRTFFDLDGHHWEVFYMNVAAFPAG